MYDEDEVVPTLVHGTVCFNRVSLRKTYLSLFDNRVFQITTKVLDRDTLIVRTVVHHYTMESMSAIVGMLLEDFLDMDEMDWSNWYKKSDM